MQITEEITFEYLCKIIGSREDLVQAGGGNISVKTKDFMYIKSSGSSLFDAKYRKVDYDKIKDYIENHDFCDDESQILMSSCIDDREKGRPSIETFFHSFTRKYTVHVHPISMVSLTKKDLEENFPDCLVIDYIKPGFNLSKEIWNQSHNSYLPEVIFLVNHGVIFNTDECDRLPELIKKINIACVNISNLDLYDYENSSFIAKRLHETYDRYFYVTPLKDRVSDINYSPDYVVYKGKISYWDDIDSNNEVPTIVRLCGVDYVVGKDFVTCKSIETLFNLYGKINKCKCNGLDESEVNELLDWDSEKYRRGNMNEVQVIVPMTGYGTRFKKAGYEDFKPFIKVNGRPMIDYVCEMYPSGTNFTFICREDTMDNHEYYSILAKYPNSRILTLKDETHLKKGPVYDVLEVKDYIDDEKQVIVNYCDFFCIWDYDKFLNDVKGYDGAVPVYTGFHPHLVHEKNVYASCRLDENGNLAEIREKYSFDLDKTKSLHSPGIYWFKSGKTMKQCFRDLVDHKDMLNGEYYASLPYNYLVRNGRKVAVPVDVSYFCQWGTPEDLEEFNMWIKILKGDNR